MDQSDWELLDFLADLSQLVGPGRTWANGAILLLFVSIVTGLVFESAGLSIIVYSFLLVGWSIIGFVIQDI